MNTPTWTRVRLEERGAVCHLALHRPEAGNRIDVPMVRELEEACHYLEDDSPSSLVVVRGSGGVFTEGIDLGEFSLERPPDVHGFHRWEKALQALEKLKKATVAVLEGPCRGGGVQLAMACDVRLATRSARLAVDEVKLGFLPGLGTWRLPRFIGLGRARELVATGRTLTGDEAREVGLVDRVCAEDELDAALDRTLADLLPVNGTPLALARRLLGEAFSESYETALGNFLAAQARCLATEPFLRQYQQRLQPRDEAPPHP